MTTPDPNNPIPPQVLAELQAAVDRATKGLRDPQLMAKACERMDQRREQIRRQHGVLDIGVSAIRELRDGE